MIVSIPDHCLSIYFDCVCPCSSVVLTLRRMPFFSIKVANKNSGFLKFYVRSKQVNFLHFSYLRLEVCQSWTLLPMRVDCSILRERNGTKLQ